MIRILSLAFLVALSGCVSSNVTPLAQDTVMISTSAAPACGQQGAQKVAIAEAAAETIRRGYDKFVVVGAQSANNVRVVGQTPITSNTNLAGSTYGSTFNGTASTTYSGGTPIIGGSHDQDFEVRMFKTGDPGSENALDARLMLGPKWEEAVAKPKQTCF